MSLPIISADQRLAEPRGMKGCIFGKSGIGKTSLLWTFDPDRTLFMDLEAGDLAIEGWAGDSVRPRTWTECRDFAVFIGGSNPALRDEQPYNPAHYNAVCDRFVDLAALDRHDTIFVDSITVAGRLCFGWCKGQPEALSEKTGKPDVRGAYGLHGREMIGWLTHLQHTRAKNVWFVAVYLNGEFTVTEGQYARRKIFTLIGLYSPKGPDWTNMGLSLVRGMLNSARGISDKDMSAEAQAARRVNGFSGAPGSGVAITAGFEFDVPVRFDTDALEVTLDLERLGSITSIPLLELRR